MNWELNAIFALALGCIPRIIRGLANHHSLYWTLTSFIEFGIIRILDLEEFLARHFLNFFSCHSAELILIIRCHTLLILVWPQHDLRLSWLWIFSTKGWSSFLSIWSSIYVWRANERGRQVSLLRFSRSILMMRVKEAFLLWRLGWLFERLIAAL